ncbi:hypothetical protein PFMG_01566 [Plasmodium falciparum IGH-CR14]|uniref:DUF155 domain-containing protein n=1 Tax=Plasmodium falciparum IGH-CR14 TaxID=580059 RepID=A0A0L1I7Y4_PLAFA|nr:hypothetical protein PFMG_01566 [Plasmodium falciparum IGH-CR14]
MYVLFNDHLKEEGEQNVKLQICNGQNNSSSENENTLSSKYFRKENRRFKQNINILDKHIILADNFGDVPEENFELPDNKQNELEILRKRRFSALIKDFKTHNVNSDLIKIKKVYSEILFMYLKDYLSEAHTENNNELDSMFYIMNVQNELSDNKSVKAADSPSFKIKNDIIYIYTKDIFEKLSYSYAFAQSVKLSYFENVVDVTIEKTKSIPECLARTGKIQLKKNDISKKIGELFVNRFYINMNTDMLDTPEIFWDHDDFTDTYEYFGKYLDISKRVEILNHRLDIIKDLYDMLQNELTIQHGYKLEWIVIYLICIEVLIDIVWTIIIKGVFKWG